jgi:hypothetical protein
MREIVPANRRDQRMVKYSIERTSSIVIEACVEWLEKVPNDFKD